MSSSSSGNKKSDSISFPGSRNRRGLKRGRGKRFRCVACRPLRVARVADLDGSPVARAQKIDWFRLSDLPTWDRDANHRKGKTNAAVSSSAASARSRTELANGKQAKFYMVTPFIS